MRNNDKNDNFKFIPSEIKSILKEIRELAARPDTATEAFARLETVINSSSPVMLQNLKNSFNEAFNLFMPKKRKRLVELFEEKFKAPPPEPSKKKPESVESSLLKDIRKELSLENADAAFDLFCDLVLSSDKTFLLKNAAPLNDISLKFNKEDKKEARSLFEKRAGRPLSSDADKFSAEQKSIPGDRRKATPEINTEKIFKDIHELIKRPDRTAEAFSRLEKFINESDNELVRKTGERINELLNSFLPGKQKKLRELLSEKLAGVEIFSVSDSGAADAAEVQSAINEINALLSRPDTITEAYSRLYESISAFSADDLKLHEDALKNAINSFFPKKRRDLLRLYSSRLKRQDDAAWDIAYEEILTEIRRRAATRMSHEKSFAELSDVIMTCDDATLNEYKDDIQEISLFLPGHFRKNISSLIGRRIGFDEEVIPEVSEPDEPVRITDEPAPAPEATIEELAADDAPEFLQEPSQTIVEEAPETVVSAPKKQKEPPQKFSYPIIHERFNFTEHAVTRTGQRGVSFDSIEMAFQYGRQEHSRGAVYYVIGRAEVEEYKSVAPEIIRHEGLHVVCSSDDGAIMTVFKNKDLTAVKHKKNAPGKQRRQRYSKH